MRQDFDPPLVIGYLGFDREILRDGQGVYLGPPIATNDVLVHGRAVPTAREFFTADQTEITKARARIESKLDADRRWDIAAAKLRDPDFLDRYEKEKKSNSPAKAAFSTALEAYLADEPLGTGWRHTNVVRALNAAIDAQ
jgi:hypothetical protein